MGLLQDITGIPKIINRDVIQPVAHVFNNQSGPSQPQPAQRPLQQFRPQNQPQQQQQAPQHDAMPFIRQAFGQRMANPLPTFQAAHTAMMQSPNFKPSAAQPSPLDVLKNAVQQTARTVPEVGASVQQLITHKPVTLQPNKAGQVLFGKTPIQSIQQDAAGAQASHPGGFHIPHTPITLTPKETGAAESLLHLAQDASVVVPGAKAASTALDAVKGSETATKLADAAKTAGSALKEPTPLNEAGAVGKNMNKVIGADGSQLIDMNGKNYPLNKDGTITVYHETNTSDSFKNGIQHDSSSIAPKDMYFTNNPKGINSGKDRGPAFKTLSFNIDPKKLSSAELTSLETANGEVWFKGSTKDLRGIIPNEYNKGSKLTSLNEAGAVGKNVSGVGGESDPVIKAIANENKFKDQIQAMRQQAPNDNHFYENTILNNVEKPGDVGNFARHVARRVEGGGENPTNVLNDALQKTDLKAEAAAQQSAHVQELKSMVNNLEKSTGQKGLYSSVLKNMAGMNEKQQLDYLGKSLTSMRDNGVLAMDHLNKEGGFTPPKSGTIKPSISARNSPTNTRPSLSQELTSSQPLNSSTLSSPALPLRNSPPTPVSAVGKNVNNMHANSVDAENAYRQWLGKQPNAIKDIQDRIDTANTIPNLKNRANFLTNAKREIDKKYLPQYSSTLKGSKLTPLNEQGAVKFPVRGSADVPTPKASSFANKTVQASPQLAPELKAMVKDQGVQYTPQTEAAGIANADKYAGGRNLTKITNDTLNTLSKEPGTITRQDALNAHAVALKLQEKAGVITDPAKITPRQQSYLDSAANIIGKTSEHYTAGGQLVQAASTISKQTPQGMMYSAIKTLGAVKDKAGASLLDKNPQLLGQVSQAVDKIKATQPGTTERSLASQDLIKLVNKNLPRSTADKITSYWVAGLLTGPETAAKVGVSHLITAPIELASKPVSAAVDKGISLATGKRGFTFNPSDYGTFAKGAVNRGLPSVGEKLRTGRDLPNTGGFPMSMGRHAGQSLYEQIPYRVHGSLMKPNFSGAFDMSVKEQARTEAINQGLKGTDRQAFIDNFTKNPSQAIQEAATQSAENFTNMQHTSLGKATSAIQGIKVGSIPVGRYIAPFTRIPTAIAAKGIVDWTPLGLGKAGLQVVKAARGGTLDQATLSQTIGRSLTGSVLTTAVGYELAKRNDLTLKAPSDPKEKALWAAEGKRPNSIKVGGKWVSLNAFGPAGISIGLGGAFGQSIKDGQNPLSAVSNAVTAAGGLVADQPYFKGLSGVANALSDPKQKGTTFFDNTVGSIIPALSSQTARGIDKYQRVSPPTVTGKIQGEIPGARGHLPAQRDPFGQPIQGANPKGTALGGILGTINPFYPSSPQNTNDSATKELQRLYDLQKSQGPNISNPTTIAGKPVKQYTPQQVQQFIADSGPTIHNAVNNLVNNSQYQSLNDAQKTQTINSAIVAARQATQVFTPSTGYLSSETKGAPSLIAQVVNYAKAFMTDPGTAWKDLTNGQIVTGTKGGGILVQRAGVASTNALINSRGGSTQGGVPLQLDHKVPIELGGTNKVDNLALIPKASDAANNKAENFLGTQLKNGSINMKTAQQLILAYKSGSLTGQQLFEQGKGKGANSIPNPTTQTTYNNQGVAGSKGTALSKQTVANPSDLGKGSIKTSKAGKSSLASSSSASGTAASDAYKLAQAQLSGARLKNDLSSWMKIADSQVNSLNQQINDPNATDLQKQLAQNKLTSLQSQISKYNGYGGFTKGKSSKSSKSTTGKGSGKSSARAGLALRAKEFSALGKSFKVPKGARLTMPRTPKPRAVRFTYKAPKLPTSTKGLRLSRKGL